MKLTKKQLVALLKFVSKDDCRPNIFQLWFQGKTAVATDGHRLAYISESERPPDRDDSGFGVPADELRRFVRSMAVRQSLVMGPNLSVLGGGRSLSPVNVSSLLSRSGVAFPDYHQVFPKKQSARSRPMAFNPAYLADLACMADLAGLSRPAAVIPVFPTAYDEPLIFALSLEGAESAGCHVGVVIMPMRTAETTPADPSS